MRAVILAAVLSSSVAADADPALQRQVQQGLRDPKAAGQLASVVESLAGVQGPKALELLAALQSAEDPAVRQRALDLIRAHDPAQVVRLARVMTTHRDPLLRLAAVRLATKPEQLLPALRERDAGVRRAAATALAAFPAPGEDSAGRSLISALQTSITEVDPGVRLAAATTLVGWAGGNTAARRLLPLLLQNNHEGIAWAVGAEFLKQLDPEQRIFLVQQFKDPKPGNRLAALALAQSSADSELAEPALSLLGDRDPEIRAQVCDLLALRPELAAGERRAAVLAGLTAQLKDRERRVREAAAVAAVRIDPQALLPALGGAIDRDDQLVQGLLKDMSGQFFAEGAGWRAWATGPGAQAGLKALPARPVTTGLTLTGLEDPAATLAILVDTGDRSREDQSDIFSAALAVMQACGAGTRVNVLVGGETAAWQPLPLPAGMRSYGALAERLRQHNGSGDLSRLIEAGQDLPTSECLVLITAGFDNDDGAAGEGMRLAARNRRLASPKRLHVIGVGASDDNTAALTGLAESSGGRLVRLGKK
jgi:hypothetical protein